MNAMTCPEQERLEEYLLGRLDPVGNEAIDEHLDHCPTCLSAVETLDESANAVFSCLRQAPPPQAEFGEPVYQRLVDRAKMLGSESVTVNGRPEIAAGLVLGNYVLGEPIGAGGMGHVYKAEHVRMKRVVALKVLPPELFQSPAARARFRREVEAAARLTSPHIVAAFDAGESEGRDYLVMEYVEGRTLADVVRQEGPLAIREALETTLQAARGLEHAHAAGIVHRDIKPANLILTQGRQVNGQNHAGIVKILDMGLARIHQPNVERHGDLTGAQVVMGTAAYMAPEQAADTRQADQRADIYSLGCTLFFLLTGRPPYEGNTAMETLFAHREQPVPSLRSARPDCPAEVAAFFRKLVAKKPAERPASMKAVIAELERLLGPGHAKSSARRRSWWVVAGAALAASVLAIVFLPMLGHYVAPESKENGQGSAGNPKAASHKTNGKAPQIDMVHVAAGEFWMGASESDRDAAENEKPRRRVKITQAFFLGKTKITQAQYKEVMGTNPSAFSAAGRFKERVKGKDTKDHPVESISWLDAVRFCNRLSERHELPPYYQIDGDRVTVRGGAGYRLPTEAEWEFAARAGSTTTWYFGENPAELAEHAWYLANSGDITHPVALKKPNPHGLHDIYGNVPEWCWDRYDPTYYKRMPLSDPPGSGEGTTRVYRGGAWNVAAPQTRTSSRDSLGSAYSVLTIVGMRVARNAE